jgi:tetratricopeptide (TPR) repeat protein
VAAAFWPALGAALTSWDDPVYAGAELRGALGSFVLGNYHPLTMLSFAAGRLLLGPSPAGQHAVSLLLHVANTLLALRLLRRLGAGGTAAFAAALLFGIHPLRVEPVAWVAARKDLLCALFSLASLLGWLAWQRSGRAAAWAGSLAALLAALLSKGSALALPAVLPLMDYLQGRRPTRRSLAAQAPFAVLSVVFGAVALQARGSFEGILGEDTLALPGRVALSLLRLPGYFLRRFVAPGGFGALYPGEVIRGETAAALPALVAAAAVLLALAGLVALSLRRTRWVLFGGLFFLATLSPALTVSNVGPSADRFLYLPALGLFAVAGVGLAGAAEAGRSPAPWRRPAALVALALVAVALILACRRECDAWRDSAALWSRAARRFPAMADMEANLGRALAERGDAAGALAAYDRALALAPELPAALLGRARVLAGAGRYDEALRDCDRALRADARLAPAYNLRALVLATTGRPDAALADLDAALGIEPGLREARLNRADLLAERGDEEHAGEDYAVLLAADPDDLQALLPAAELHLRSGAAERAVAAFTRALRLEPRLAAAYRGRAAAYERLGERALAERDRRTLAGLGPGVAVVLPRLRAGAR